MARKLEYFYSLPHVELGHGDEADDPSSPGFIDMNQRGEMERTRWWHKHNEKQRKLLERASAEFYPQGA